MHGRVCLVTGATSGIGFVTARELARRGATVAIVTRDRGRGEQAIEQFRAAAPDATLDLIVGDLALVAGVRTIAASFLARHSELDVLVNNAGAIHARRELTEDGIERTFALNHLAYFQLTALLRPALEAAPAGRVVSVSSDGHRAIRALDFENLQGERRYVGMRAYCASKLANVLFTYELARRLTGTRVTANCLHPGMVRTGFGHNDTGLTRLLFTLAAPFLIAPEQGAETSIHLAWSLDVAGVTGRYFVKRHAVRSSAASYDETAARRLWNISEQMIDASTPDTAA